MGDVSSLFAHKVAATAAAGDDGRRRALLASVGLDPDAAPNAKLMIADLRYYAFCADAVAAAEDGASLPMRVGGSMRCDDYGAFGLAWKTAVDLRGSYRRAERYGRILTSVSAYTLRETVNGVVLTHHRAGTPSDGMAISNEQTMAAIVTISREVGGGGFRPTRVSFAHDAPSRRAAHEAFFGCPIHYGADIDSLEVPASVADRPNRLGDRGVSAFMDAHLDEELAERGAHDDWDGRIRTHIADALSDGPPSIGDVARRLGVSTRTLQRRLSESGVAFQTLRDGARRDLAETLLRKTQYGLSEVAFLTGFSEQSSFNRAFKRWNGKTPAAFRQTATL